MTHSTLLLVIRPKPAAHESLLGYCLRLGDANGFQNLKWLSTMAAKSESDQTALQRLSSFTGHPADVLNPLAGPAPVALRPIQDWRLGLKATYWNHGHRRWCPLCLKESSIWKTEWMLALQIACPTHQIMLQEHCPGCGSLVPWHRGGLFRCPCGADLRQVSSTSASPKLLSLARILSAAFQRATGLSSDDQPPNEESPLLIPLHLPQLCNLLWVFGAYALHHPGAKPQNIPHHGQMKVTVPYLSMAMQVLDDWPHHFHQLLAEYTKPVAGQTASLRVYLRQLHLALSTLLIHPDLQFLREEFEHYVHSRWQNKLILQPALRDAHPIMSATEAAKTLNISVRTLHQLVTAGEVQGSQTISANGRIIWLVERASVQLFSQHKHGGLLTLKQVESLLRITPKRIRLLTECGLLVSVRKATDGPINTRHWLFKHSDVNTFLKQLNHGNVSTTPECAQLVSVWEITKRWMQGDEAFLDTIKALYSGDLPVVGRSPAEAGLRALLVSRDRFKEWHLLYRLSRGFYTIPEAARKIGIDRHLLYRLVQIGLITAEQKQYGCENKMILGIKEGEVERFTRDYIWGKSLSRALGSSDFMAVESLMRQGIIPAFRPTLDGTGGYVFRRSDIAPWLKSNPVEQVRIQRT